MSTGLSARQKILLNINNRFRANEAQLHTLRYLFWECTLRCNLNCLHCGSDCQAKSDIHDMPAEDFLKVTDSISKYIDPLSVTVVLTGGEPLLRKDLNEIGFALRKQGFRWSLVTNGYLLDQARLNELVNAGLGAITISLDGPPAEHNWLRNNPSSYHLAIEAIRQVARYGRLNSDVVTCVYKRNIDLLAETRELLAETGIRKWRLFTVTPIGRAANIPELKLSGSELIKLMEFIKINRQMELFPEASFSCESYMGQYEGIVREGFFFCRAGIHIGSILADGSISACPNIDRNFVQGNIYQDDFMEVWNSRFLPFRNRSWTRIHECSACRHYKYCQGNGMHWWKYPEGTMARCLYQEIGK